MKIWKSCFISEKSRERAKLRRYEKDFLYREIDLLNYSSEQFAAYLDSLGRLTIERHLQNLLPLDVLFEDKNGNLIVVEVKLGKIGRDAVRQTKNYIRELRAQQKKNVAGIILCAGIMPAYEEELRNEREIRILVHGWDLRVQPWFES